MLSVAALVAFAASALLARATNAGVSSKQTAGHTSSLSAPSSFLSALSHDNGSGGFDSGGGSVAPAQSPEPPAVSSGGS